MSTLKQLQKAIDDQLAGDGSALRHMSRELYSENERLKKQIENLLKPMRDKIAEERDALRNTLQEIADEAVKHHEYNPISGVARLPRGYTNILNLADRALCRSNTQVSQPGQNLPST